MALKNLCSVFIVLLFSFSLFFSKAIAEPSFVQSKSIETGTQDLGLTFNNDGTKMYITRNPNNKFDQTRTRLEPGEMNILK